MNCSECGAHVPVWGCVTLCDRCLDARLYRELKDDEFVLLRRTAGRLSLASGKGGSRWSDLTALKLDPETETLAAVRTMLGVS